MTVVQSWDLGDGTASAAQTTSVAVTVVDGIIGRDGAPGANGTNGTNGTNGAPGTNGTNGTDGAPGADGVGVPVGGTTGQVLAKIDATDYNTDWVDQTGGGAVDSVNGQVGVVVLAAADVGADTAAGRDAAIGTAISAATSTEVTRADAAYDPAGAASTAQTNAEAYTDAVSSAEVTRANAAYDVLGAAASAQAAAEAASQPLDSDLTAIAALTTTTFGRALLTQADAAATRSTLGLGTAATSASSAFDAAGAAAAAQAAAIAASQPLDSDLTAIAALTTTTFGRALLTETDAAATRTALGLGTAATSASSAFDAAGAAAAAQAASQPLDSDLTAIAALATTAFGRSFLALADAAAGRTLLGLGTLATQSGTFSGTSSGTNTGDQSIPTALPPNGAASGDLSGSYPSPTVAKINGTALSGLATGLLKNTTTTGVPSIAAAADVPTVAAGGTGPLSASDVTTTNSRTPTAHHTTHESGGTDAVSLAASQITSGVLAIGRLASGTPDGTKFVRDDGTLVTPSGSDTTRMKYQGDWLGTSNYALNDVVRNGNKLYVCTTAVTGTSVSSSFIGSAANKVSSAATFTLAIPGTAVAGDLALIAIESNTIVAPSYATGLASGIVNTSWRTALYSYTLTAADITATTLTIPVQGSAGASGTLHVFRNAAVSGSVVQTTTLTTTSIAPPAGAAFVYDVGSTASVGAADAVLSQASLSGVVTAVDRTSSSTVIGAGYETAAAGVATTTRTWSVTNEVGAGADRQTFSLILITAGSTPFPTGSFDLLARTVNEAVNTVAASGTAQVIPDTTSAMLNQITLTGACTFTFPGAAAGKRFQVALKQDGTGSRTVTWPATVKWPAGTTPTLTTAAAKTDHFQFVCYDGISWLGQTLGLNY